MKTRSFSAALIATVLMVALPATSAWAAHRSEAEQAIAEAEAAREKAASVGGEWRDTAKMIKEATALLDTRQYTKAIEIANKAKRQGELGYEQAMNEKGAGFPEFMMAHIKQDEAATVSAAETIQSVDNRITPDLAAVEVMHNGEPVVISRGHQRDATLPEEFAKTDRGCPPFCVQPMVAAEGVETIGEIQMIDYLAQASAGQTDILIVDSRTPDWVMRGTIPGAVNIPWNKINEDLAGTFQETAEAETLDEIMTEQFGATKTDGTWDFSNAKTLVLFCNGIWCPQSTLNIRTLVEMGYPADKLKWYRGGMQDWVSVGLTTVKP